MMTASLRQKRSTPTANLPVMRDNVNNMFLYFIILYQLVSSTNLVNTTVKNDLK